ncbi:sterol desaturase family protein [Variovorax sp. YR752]|uniref:sterol desaturase family protein n=1 Tax=Variovorax sp. YR752 TaxID=1884383 RepID=UPI0031382579
MNREALRQSISPEWLPWLSAALLLALGAALAEGVLRSLRRGGYDWRAFAATLGDVAGRRLGDALGLSLAAPLLMLAWQHRITTLVPDSLATVAALFVGQEFCYYWQHRAAHRVRWFWASHCVHHSPNQLTLASALRLGWTGKLSGAAVFFTPLVWLGFHPLVVAAAVALNLLYQFWLHATWIPRLGPLEWLLNTPSHHRVHHARNPEYLDCNYGGVLIVFDRLFGSFVAERDDNPPRYGLTVPLHSYNPLRIALHGWLTLAADLRLARSPRDALHILFGPPDPCPLPNHSRSPA